MFYLKTRGPLWSVIFCHTFTPEGNSSHRQIPSLGHKKWFGLLQVVNGCDPSWWQARHEAGDTIGLVPSQVQTRPDQTRPDQTKIEIRSTGPGGETEMFRGSRKCWWRPEEEVCLLRSRGEPTIPNKIVFLFFNFTTGVDFSDKYKGLPWILTLWGCREDLVQYLILTNCPRYLQLN